MAKELTSEERIHFSDLKLNFHIHVERYRREKKKELQRGREVELRQEMKKLQDYLALYHRGEVDDLIVNIEFSAAKINVLREMLRVSEPENTPAKEFTL